MPKYNNSHKTTHNTPHNIPAINLDKWILASMLLLMLIGTIMVASSSISVASQDYNQPLFFLTRQLIFVILSLITGSIVLFIPISFYWNKRYLILTICFVLLIAVITPGIGQTINGAKRWINLGIMSMQVSEIVKLGVIIYLAAVLEQIKNPQKDELKNFTIPFIIIGAASLLLLLEPDFGATFVLCLTCTGLLFISGVRIRWFAILIILMLIAMTALVILSPYRFARLTGFINPWENQYTSGYQLTQSLIAFGNGGLFGVGLGNSIQKLFYLPEAHTDFVLAITAEEFGLLGVMIILALYIILIGKGFKIAYRLLNCRYKFHSYLAYGITFWIGLQTIINIGVNIGLMPTKGLTLPFISYGGSSLMLNTIAIAILLRLDFELKFNQNKILNKILN